MRKTSLANRARTGRPGHSYCRIAVSRALPDGIADWPIAEIILDRKIIEEH
jgi:hypothetical protein